MLECKYKLATSKCQEPRRHAPGKQPTDATRISIPRMYLASCICDVYIYYMSVSKLVAIELLSL